MINNKKNRRVYKRTNNKLKKSKLYTDLTEESKWHFNNSTDINLTKIFGIVIMAHVLFFAGLYIFKLMNNPNDKLETSSEKINKKPKPSSALIKSSRKNIAKASRLSKKSNNTTYVVRSKDSIKSIANKFNVSELSIKNANSIISSSELYDGLVIKIPKQKNKSKIKDKVETKNLKVIVKQPEKSKDFENVKIDRSLVKLTPIKSAEEKRVSKKISSSKEYIIKPGDTIWKISRKFDITSAHLIKINNIVDPQNIQVGQKINIYK